MTIFPGDKAFFLMDTIGLWPQALHDLLQQHDMILDCAGFFRAAQKAGWHPQKAARKLVEDMEIPYTARCNPPLERLHPKEALEQLAFLVFKKGVENATRF